ncbi:hypothetical protein K438DRAFT_2000479 [Mycena galopus ATCC 62051]|nr:hypothetical protein K438DRAFT_2000479 [Mycena galopus ATCC 62051]
MHTTALKAIGSELRALMPVGKHPYNPNTDVFHLRTGQQPPSLICPLLYSEMAFPMDGASTAVTAATKPWKSSALLIFLATPSSPHRKQPRRRKYYGQFEACSRADVLPKYAESDDEDRDGVEEVRCYGGWSVQEMKRCTSILRSSLLGEYHTIPEPVQVPTGPGL